MSIKETQPNQETEQILLAQLINHPIIKQTLNDHDVRYLVKPRQASDLDIAFVSKNQPKRPITGIPMFGLDSCIGAVAIKGKHQLASTERRLRENPNLSHLFDAGADIITLTQPDIKNWISFLDQVQEGGWIENWGEKILTQSGLERLTHWYQQSIERNLETILNENNHYLWNHKVGSIAETDLLDAAFLSKNEQDQRFVPIAHAKEAWMHADHILDETAHSAPIQSPGLIVPQPFENKREAYLRAQNAKACFQQIYPNKNIVIPVASAGQISLWRKLGFSTELMSHLIEADLSTEELVRFLFLGDSVINSGELARMGYSIPGNIQSMIGRNGKENSSSVFDGVDLVFFKTDKFKQRRLTTIERPVLGIDLNALKREELKTKPFSHIGGIIIMPDHWSVEQMHHHAKPLQKMFEHHKGDPTAHLLYVNRWLLDQWKAQGSIFAPEKQIEDDFKGNVQNISASKKVEYGLGVSQKDDVQIFYTRFQPKSMVGGTIDAVVEKAPSGEKEFHFLNLGAYFGNASHIAYTGLTGKPSTALGITPLLQTGELPLIPNLWEPEYLLKGAMNNPSILKRIPGDNVGSFIRANLTYYYGRDLRELMDPKAASKILRLGKKDMRIWQNHLHGIRNYLLQHPHADHHNNLAFAHRDIEAIGRTEGIAILQALTYQARTWKDKPTIISHLVHKKIGARYQTSERPLRKINWDDQIINLSPHITYQAPLINHSIPGSAMQIIRTPGGTLINSGDIRPGSMSEKTLTQFENQADVLILETTNNPNTKKSSSGITEIEVRENLKKAFDQNPGKIIVLAMPKNHPVRLNQAMQAAREVGRQIAISDKHANIISQLHLSKSRSPISAEGFDYELPVVGEDVGLWLREREQPSTYIKSLKAIASNKKIGVVDHFTLSENGDKWVVVIDPWELLLYNFGNTILDDKGLAYIWSSYYTYDVGSKNTASANVNWLQQQAELYTKKDFPFYGDFQVRGRRGIWRKPTHPGMSFHASGHGDFNYMVDVAHTLLDNNKGTVVLVHGEHTDTYARNLREHVTRKQEILYETEKKLQKTIGPDHSSRLRIYSRLKPYNPNNPLSDTNPLGLNTFALPINS